uniref:Uncharacterized protein n=1 Tax=Stomoxys calcitrans TaxID=35570 RepID=A0A1I8PDZ2_STOCA
MLPCNKINLSISIKSFMLMALTVANLAPANGKRIKLLPLSASQVYRVLRETQNMEAVPEGRVVTEGIAAAIGFNMGLATGLGGLFLFEIVTANVSGLDAVGREYNPDMSERLYKSQEICFNTRLARNLEEADADAVAETYFRFKDKRYRRRPADIRLNEQERRSWPMRKASRYTKKRKRYSRGKRRRNPHTAKFDGIRFLTVTDALNSNVEEERAAPTTSTGSDGDDGLQTIITTTTSSDDDDDDDADSPVTCIVVKKPAK